MEQSIKNESNRWPIPSMSSVKLDNCSNDNKTDSYWLIWKASSHIVYSMRGKFDFSLLVTPVMISLKHSVKWQRICEVTITLPSMIFIALCGESITNLCSFPAWSRSSTGPSYVKISMWSELYLLLAVQISLVMSKCYLLSPPSRYIRHVM